jgi:hypothetical protein
MEHAQQTGNTKVSGSRPLPSVISKTQPFVVQSALMVSPQKEQKKNTKGKKVEPQDGHLKSKLHRDCAGRVRYWLAKIPVTPGFDRRSQPTAPQATNSGCLGLSPPYDNVDFFIYLHISIGMIVIWS